MVQRLVPTLKFSGVVSLGILTGFCYSMGSMTLPTLTNICTPSSSSEALEPILDLLIYHAYTLTSFSSCSFFLAYLFSPPTQKHPYLLWTSLLIGSSLLVDFIPVLSNRLSKSISVFKGSRKNDKTSTRLNNQLDASYEVLNKINHSDDENEELGSNQTCIHFKNRILTERIRTAFTGIGFTMSIIGIWGDRFNGFITRT